MCASVLHALHVKHAQHVANALHVTQTRKWSGLAREACSARAERVVFHAPDENFYILFVNFTTLVLHVIYQQGKVFQILSLSISGETLFQMFDVAS